MKKRFFFAFFLIWFLTLLACYAEGNSYKIDSHTTEMGMTSDEHIIIVDVFFSIECFFESNTSRTIQRLYSLIIEQDILRFLLNYIAILYIPQFTVRDFYLCQTEFYKGFMNYISEQLPKRIAEREGLNNVRITRLEIVETPFSEYHRLRILEALE